jgi:hypothetical protein
LFIFGKLSRGKKHKDEEKHPNPDDVLWRMPNTPPLETIKKKEKQKKVGK